MRLSFIFSGLMAATLLYSQDLTVEGVWNGGGSEVYTTGNEQYCFKPDQDSSASFNLDALKNSLESCIYLTYGKTIASKCGLDPTLNLQDLNDLTYKIVIAPGTTVTNEQYTLDINNYSGIFGRCTDYYQSGYVGMTIEDFNFLLGLAGLFSAIILYGSITYVILTLGNF